MGGLRPREKCKVERPKKPAEGLLVVPLERMVRMGGRAGWMGGCRVDEQWTGSCGVDGWAGATRSSLPAETQTRGESVQGRLFPTPPKRIYTRTKPV
jgi:hypothetical protein